MLQKPSPGIFQDCANLSALSITLPVDELKSFLASPSKLPQRPKSEFFSSGFAVISSIERPSQRIEIPEKLVIEIGYLKQKRRFIYFMRIITDARGQPQFVLLLEYIDAISGVWQEQRKSINFYSKSLKAIWERISYQKLCRAWWRCFISANQMFKRNKYTCNSFIE